MEINCRYIARMRPQDDNHDEILPFLPAPRDGRRWRAPALREQRLHELCLASAAGHDRAHLDYLRLVAAEGLYRPVPKALADREDKPPPAVMEHDGRRFVQAYTAGVLPRPHPEVVYEFTTVGELAVLWPDDADTLLINGGTPCAMWYLADEEERETWYELHQELFRPDGTNNRVETRWTGAPDEVDTLRGLACGAHLCYANGDAWNTLNWHGAGYRAEVERLAQWWDIHGREDWMETTEQLLGCETSPWGWDFVLGAREWLVRETGGARVDPVRWRDCAEATIRGANPDADPRDLDALVEELRGLVGKVTRYEARFRADGLLPPDGHVRTVAAWDLGRATMVARWGRGARYCTDLEMRTVIERAGKDTQRVYESWAEFSAGYVLGRCLHFDEEAFGEWYTSVLDAHRALLTDPESPWNRVPLHG